MNTGFVGYFQGSEEPRVYTENMRHDLLDIVAISILAVVSGAEGWTDISAWAQTHQDWLATFLRCRMAFLPVIAFVE